MTNLSRDEMDTVYNIYAQMENLREAFATDRFATDALIYPAVLTSAQSALLTKMGYKIYYGSGVGAGTTTIVLD